MNERIYELAKQADLIEWDILPSGARTPDHESVVKAQKFAELIVRECARIARNTDLEDVGGGDSAVLRAAGEQIQKHFGVLE